MAVREANSTPNVEAIVAPEQRRLSLRANFSWTFAGNVIYAGCQWGMLVVLAKAGSPETVGRFALALAITAPIVMLTNLQLRSVQATDPNHEYQFGEYLALRMAMTALALLVIGGIVLVSGYSSSQGFVILAVAVAKGFEAISDVVYGALQQHERMDRISISMMIKGFLSLAALAVGVLLTGDVFWGAVALAAAWGTILIAYDLPNAARVLKYNSTNEAPTGGPEDVSRIKPIWSLRKLARLAWLCLPLGVVMLLVSLNTNIPRYFVEHFNGTHDLGIFAAMAYLMTAATTVISALGQSASPRLARYYVQGDTPAFRMLMLKLLAVAIGLGVAGIIGAMLLGRELLTVLYSPEYASYLDVFVWIMVAVGLWNVASMFGYAATARRRIRMQPVALLVIVATSIATGFLLVPPMGLWGASLSMVTASIVAVFSYGLLNV